MCVFTYKRISPQLVAALREFSFIMHLWSFFQFKTLGVELRSGFNHYRLRSCALVGAASAVGTVVRLMPPTGGATWLLPPLSLNAMPLMLCADGAAALDTASLKTAPFSKFPLETSPIIGAKLTRLLLLAAASWLKLPGISILSCISTVLCHR
jgi:hypothetical protein